MPNHVKNTIYFDCSETKLHEVLTAIQDDEKGYGTIDFNKLIPMPESLNITAGSQTNDGIKLYSAFVDGYRSSHPQLTDNDLLHIPESEEQAYLDSHADIDAETFHLGKAAYRNKLLYGYSTWYEWSNEQWNTKWNAYHCSMEDEYTISFETAWCAPHPVIEELSARFTGVYIVHCWADEDLGHNCGRLEYLNGECVGNLTPETDVEANEFAALLWNCDLEADCNMCVNIAGTRYINVSCDNYEQIELFGKVMLFTNERLTDEDIPKGLYHYDLRESDTGDGFAAIEPVVIVNHGGTVVCAEPIDFGENGYIPFDEDSSPNFLGITTTIGEYMHNMLEQTKENEPKMGGIRL